MRRAPAWAAIGIIAALTLSAADAQAAPSSAASTRASWNLQYRSAKPEAPLVAVLAPGRKDAWAFGQTTAGGGLALHWTGGRWHSVRLPGAANFAPFDADASSPSYVWVLGDKSITVRGVVTETAEEILRFNGSGWLKVPVPPATSPQDLAVVSSSDVWALAGSTGCTPACSTALLHWTGKTWLTGQVPIPEASVAATSGGQVWAVGSAKLNRRSQPAGPTVAYTWTGRSWRYVKGIPDRNGLGACQCGFAIAANNNVWIENAHWNGKHWHLLRIPPGEPVQAPMVPDGNGGMWFGPWVHWTGRSWINTLLPPYGLRWLPGYASIGIYTMARIPGSSTLLAGGAVTGKRASNIHAVLMSCGKMP